VCSSDLTGLSAGTANITVTTADGGFSATCNITVQEGTPGSYTLQLKQGWNFISVPKRLAEECRAVANLFSQVDTAGHSIFLYQPDSGWGEGMAAGDEVKPLDGIWIYSATDCSVNLHFDTNPLQVPPVKDLPAGWNAVGFSDTLPAAANSTLASVEEEWAYAIGFDPSTQTYETSIINNDHGGGTHDESNLLQPGKGYWLYMRKAAQLAGIGM